MKKNIPTPLTDALLNSIGPIQEAETSPYFYTRLKARMEKGNEKGVSYTLRPAWLVSMLVIILFINAFFLITQNKSNSTTYPSTSGIQNFANSYDLTIPNSF